MNASDPRSHLKLKPARPFISVRSALLADTALFAAVAAAFVALLT
jgi:hypothetical protein